MHIHSIKLEGFRNYPQLEVNCQNQNKIFICGENAQGKTNFLEALYFTSTFRSPRADKLNTLINYQSDYFVIQVNFQGQQPGTLAVKVNNDGSKYIRYNGNACRHIKDVLGKIPMVFFKTDDVEVVTKDPSRRRRFLDIYISLKKPLYTAALLDYVKFLKQKNSYLQKIKAANLTLDPILLETYNEELVKTGKVIVQERFQNVQQLTAEMQNIYRQVFKLSEEVDLAYITDSATAEQWEDVFRQKQKEYKTPECIRGVTLIGPHRDELLIKLDGRPARYFCSQGQLRLLVLTLRLAEARLLAKELGELPIYLLDDVLLELDRSRQEAFLATIPQEAQMFFVGTAQANFSAQWLKGSKTFVVKSGQICELEEALA